MESLDWDALREAATSLPPPSPLPPPDALPRAAIFAQHTQLTHRERQLDQEGQVRTRKVVIGPGKHFSRATNVNSLRPCALSHRHLELDKPATGLVLVVRTVAAPVRAAAVQLVVEDCEGRAAPLSLYHVPARFGQRELDELFPAGAVFGVKEPLLRSLRSGFHIRIDSPSDLVRLFPSSPLLRSLPSPFPRPPAHFSDGKSPSALKDAGNAAFKAGRWIKAREAYEWALAAIKSENGSDEDEGGLGATVRSNLALVYLKLDLPSAARHVAQRALELLPPRDVALGHADGAPLALDPLRAKLLYRLSLAHYALESYPTCLETLSPLLALSPPDPLALALSTRAHARTLEAAQGPSPATLRALFHSSPAACSELDLADLASPLVGIRPSPTDPTGRRRALVALAPIPRGTLLACLKPLGIVTFNAFHVEDLASSLPGARSTSSSPSLDLDDDNSGQEGFHALTALYPPLASALNHSCVPTASYTFLRSLFLLRARVDLAPGDELTDSYADATDPLEVRAEKLAPHGFACGCELCAEERAAGEETRRERKRLVRELDEGTTDDPGEELDRVRRVKRDLEATYAAEDNGRRAGCVRPPLYAPARLLAQRLADLPSPSQAQLREAVQCEVDALRALGTVLEPREGDEQEDRRWERPRMVEPPRVGDTNAVLSALFVARVWKTLGRDEGTRHWISLARDIEVGQAGVELFELRYGDFARRHGLDLVSST
ncbi:hypothetical protein DMC30DRAFT_419814 [Rhodotorula diobovata]|uniref:SET domain-containing protein n=1 Tax=Rhodotorula diobovata TaxID=5288 RepID=A0A5C5FKN9_9BASI|nr:hypothetical protein DMC30DRAFT_419814 [Rhodotorula diobovata]